MSTSSRGDGQLPYTSRKMSTRVTQDHCAEDHLAPSPYVVVHWSLRGSDASPGRCGRQAVVLLEGNLQPAC